MLFFFQLILSGCAIAACLYYLAACVAMLSWRADARRQRVLPSFTPPVTILKPLRGAELEAYDTLASFCRLDYPTYQIVFGVQDPRDPVIPIVERLRADFPQCDIALVIDETTHGYNGKVSNLQNTLPLAKHDVLLIADADIRVRPDYLRRVIKPLQDPQVGMVTCLYCGVGAKSFGDLLENLGLAAIFAPEVLMARLLQGVKFALGATIVMRQTALAGLHKTDVAQDGILCHTRADFRAIANHLADDYELGHAVATHLNQRVVLSECIVDHVANGASLRAMFQHQLRWMRAIRVSRPAGYAGLIVTYGTVTASLLLLASGFTAWAAGLWVVTFLLRLTVAFTASAFVLRDSTSIKWFWLWPLRDVLAFVVWLLGFFGSEIVWRGERLKVLPGGKLVAEKTKR